MDKRPISAVVVMLRARDKVFMELRTRQAPVPHSRSISPVRPMTEAFSTRSALVIGISVLEDA